MTTTNTAGIKTTFPYEDSSPGVARHQCEECGAWERSDKGPIAHGRRCDSRPQVVAVPGPAATRGDLRRFANNVRRTGLTKGRDRDVADAVRLGYLSASDAMNTDD